MRGNKHSNLFLIFLVLLSTNPIQTQAVNENKYQVTLTLESPEPEINAEFGSSAALNNNSILVGDDRATVDGLPSAGKAYLFNTEGNILLTLHSPTPQSSGRFGISVGLNEETIMIGEFGATVEGLIEAGQVHFFDFDGNHLNSIHSPEPVGIGGFGVSLDSFGDLLVVGELGATVDGLGDAGQVHLFDLDGNYLNSIQSLEPEREAEFGSEFCVFGNKLVLSDFFADVDDKVDAGRVYVFDLGGNHLTTLQSPEPQSRGLFGVSIAVNEEIIVIAEDVSVSEFRNAGVVYVFDSDGDFLMTLNSPNPEIDAWFGNPVAISKDLIIVGESGADGGSINEGRVYVFDMEGVLLAILQAFEPIESSHDDGGFGLGVEVRGETIAVFEPRNVMSKSMAGMLYLFKPEVPVEIREPLEETSTEIEADSEINRGIPGYPLWSIGVALLLISLILAWKKGPFTFQL